jgi:hypothetical protein
MTSLMASAVQAKLFQMSGVAIKFAVQEVKGEVLIPTNRYQTMGQSSIPA